MLIPYSTGYDSPIELQLTEIATESFEFEYRGCHVKVDFHSDEQLFSYTIFTENHRSFTVKHINKQSLLSICISAINAQFDF